MGLSKDNADIREFRFSQSDFNRIRSILYDLSGINIADSKDSMVYSRLVRRLRALRLGGFSEYLDYLDKNNDEIEHFVNRLTTNKTSFFREEHHFDILFHYLKSASGHQKIWCAASSTGEEPYSIAMCAAEAYSSFSPPVSILATDIDSHVLSIAKKGIYSNESVDFLSQGRLKSFFFKGRKSHEGKVKIVPEIQKLVRFSQLNLTDVDWPLKEGSFDIVFCRNVMIYFDKTTQLRILKRLMSKLTPKGLYFAGHSESFLKASNIVIPIGKTVYRKA